MRCFVACILICAGVISLPACTSPTGVKKLGEGYTPEVSSEEAWIKEQSGHVHETLKRKGLILRDPEVQDYVNGIAARLVPKFTVDKQLISFYVLKNPSANAMALPNGNIYINTGLISLCENEAQLATILAHETAHVIDRHGLKSAIKTKNTLIAAHLTDLLLFGTGLSYLGAGANLASFSREQEQEADIDGIAMLVKAGYAVEEAPKTFKLFATLPELASVKGSIYSSHPENQKRISYIQALLDSEYADQIGEGVSNEESFQPIKQQVLELNVQLQLHKRQYLMALDSLDRAEFYYKRAPLIEYYRGEAYRGMADYPEDAAREKYWIDHGKRSNKYGQEYKDKINEHYGIAKSHYRGALEMNENLALAHRGLGMVLRAEGSDQDAAVHLQLYLENKREAKDARYIEHLIAELSKRHTQ